MSPSKAVSNIEINILAFGDFQTLCNSGNESTPSSFFLVPIILLIYSDQMRKISRHKLGDSAVFPSHLFGSPGNRHVSSRYQEDKFPPIILKQAVEDGGGGETLLANEQSTANLTRKRTHKNFLPPFNSSNLHTVYNPYHATSYIILGNRKTRQ